MLQTVARSQSRALTPRFGLYEVGQGRLLFVPHPAMLALHQASLPASICDRAGIPLSRYFQWMRDRNQSPDFRRQLYCTLLGRPRGDAKRLAAVTLQLPAETLQLPEGADLFVSEAQPGRTLEAAKRALANQKYKALSFGLVVYWLRRLSGQDWLEGWLWRGENAPPHVIVATPSQVDLVARVTDYGAHRRAAGIGENTYARWWKALRSHPDLLLYLFGQHAPGNVFIVEQRLKRLKHESTDKTIARTAKIDLSRLPAWKKDQQAKQALAEAIAAAESRAIGAVWQPSAALDSRRQSVIWAYAKKATLRARLARAGLRQIDYLKILALAEELGVKGELLLWLESKGHYGHGTSRRAGLLTEKLFVPWPEMAQFRQAAQKADRGGRLRALLAELPGSRMWFFDWIAPKGHEAAAPPPPGEAPAVQLEAAEPKAAEPPRKKRGRPLDPTVKDRDRKMIEAWRRREHDFSSYGELAREFGVDRSYARKVVIGQRGKK